MMTHQQVTVTISSLFVILKDAIHPESLTAITRHNKVYLNVSTMHLVGSRGNMATSISKSRTCQSPFLVNGRKDRHDITSL